MSYNDGNHCMEFHAKIYTVNGRDRSRGDLQTIRFFQKYTFPSLYMHNLDFFSKEIDVQSTTIVGIPRPASPTLTDRQ